MSTQRRRKNRSIATKLNSLDAKLNAARAAQKAPADGSVTSGSFAEGSIESPAYAPNSVDNNAIAFGAVGTENLGTINAVNSDSTLVLGGSLGVALGGDAYVDRPAAPLNATKRKSVPGYNVIMDSTGTLRSGPTSSTENVKFGIVDPLYSGGYVGVYFEYVGVPYAVNADFSGYIQYSSVDNKVSPDGYFPYFSGYDPQPGDTVVLMRDSSTSDLSAFSPSDRGAYGPSSTVDGDGWVIMGKHVSMPKQLRMKPIDDISDRAGGQRWTTTYSSFELPKWAHTIANITVVTGMWGLPTVAVPAGSILGGIPPMYCPDYRMDFEVLTSTGNAIVSIYPDGTIRNKNTLGTSVLWISMNNIKFPAKGTPWSTSDFTINSGFIDAGDSAVGPVRYWIDPYGFCWWAGMIQLTSSNPSDGTSIISTPSNTSSHNGSQYILAAGYYSGNDLAVTAQLGTSMNWKTGSPTNAGATMSLAQHCYPTTKVTSSGSLSSQAAPQFFGTAPASGATLQGTPDRVTLGTVNDLSESGSAYQNGWVSRSSTGASGGTAIPYLWGRPDGFVWMQGLLSSGTLGSAAFPTKDWYAPKSRMVTGVVSNGASGRLDVQAANITPVSGSNVYVSLDSVSYVPQGYTGR